MKKILLFVLSVLVVGVFITVSKVQAVYFPRPVDCVGSWVNSSPIVCSLTCGGGVEQQTYHITTPASNGGKACSHKNGDTQWGKTPCNTDKCTFLCPDHASIVGDKCKCNAGYYQAGAYFEWYCLPISKACHYEKSEDECVDVQRDYTCNGDIRTGGHKYELHDGACPQTSPSPSPVPQEPQAPCTGDHCGDPPTFAGSSTNPPVCSDASTIQLPANIHVVRKGSEATVTFFITQGDSANIYYKVVGQSDWQYSVPNVKGNGDNYVSYTIGGLNPALGYTFGVQQVQGCGGGQLVEAVVVDGPQARTFGFSFWQWSK